MNTRRNDVELACECGWRGKRRNLTPHPRQGFGVCPSCWRLGVECQNILADVVKEAR